MSWFYIQQWKAKRWSYVGMEMDFEQAKLLFKTLSDDFSEKRCSPLALIGRISNPKIGKVIQTKKDLLDGWEEIVVNAMYLKEGEDKPLLVKRISYE